jgi:hypothetical protein
MHTIIAQIVHDKHLLHLLEMDAVISFIIGFIIASLVLFGLGGSREY